VGCTNPYEIVLGVLVALALQAEAAIDVRSLQEREEKVNEIVFLLGNDSSKLV